MMAVRKKDYDTVARLINQDYAADMAVNVNYQEPKTGYSALHYAVIDKNTKLVNLLVKNYADVKAQDANKQNPLHLVCISGNPEIFRALLGACYSANEGIDIH
jgi:ankyrin repeat protein